MPLLRPKTTWRDWYNPIRGLSVARIVSMEDAAERGQFADLQWFWHHRERTDVTVQAAIALRLSFIDSIDWEIRALEDGRADSRPLRECPGFVSATCRRPPSRSERKPPSTRFPRGLTFPPRRPGRRPDARFTGMSAP